MCLSDSVPFKQADVTFHTGQRGTQTQRHLQALHIQAGIRQKYLQIYKCDIRDESEE